MNLEQAIERLMSLHNVVPQTLDKEALQIAVHNMHSYAIKDRGAILRMAGNIASGLISNVDRGNLREVHWERIAEYSVTLAKLIIEETKK